jgi:hypothetical protein
MVQHLNEFNEVEKKKRKIFFFDFRSHVPEPWGELMIDPEASIIDFYPEDFKIDLNGKKFAWQGVALLPFVDEVNFSIVFILTLHNFIYSLRLGLDFVFYGAEKKNRHISFRAIRLTKTFFKEFPHFLWLYSKSCYKRGIYHGI